MIKHLVTKLSSGRFNICWERRYNTAMVLDFNHLIRAYDLVPPFVIFHFQARPKGLRRWGIFDGGRDEYLSLESDRVRLDLPGRPIQIPDAEGVMPTAVLLYDKATAVAEGETIVVRRV